MQGSGCDDEKLMQIEHQQNKYSPDLEVLSFLGKDTQWSASLAIRGQDFISRKSERSRGAAHRPGCACFPRPRAPTPRAHPTRGRPVPGSFATSDFHTVFVNQRLASDWESQAFQVKISRVQYEISEHR